MKYEDIKKLIDNIAADISKLQKGEKQTFKRKIEVGDISGVIDISHEKEEKIPPKIKNDKPIVKDYRYWILKLDRHYKSKAMRVNQVNVAALKMYARLCETLELYLSEKGTTVARHVSKLRRETVNFDLYYTIYLIAETQVLNFYNPLSRKTAEKSYKIIEDYVGSDARKLLEDRADELKYELKPADKETKEYFKLTDNNKISLWWDPDGSAREKYNFTKEEQLAINQISKRSNVLWKNKKVYKLLMDLYLSTLRALFDAKDIETKRLTRVIKPYQQSKDILDAILVISEKNIREIFSFYGWISTEKASDLLKEEANIDIYNFVSDYQKDYLNNLDFKLLDEIYRDYFDKNPKKTQDFINYLIYLDIEEEIKLIKDYEDHENFEKILNELVKSWYEDEKIIALYYLYKKDLNKKSHDKYLFEIINKANFDRFLKLIKENDLSLSLIEEISKLKNIAPKKIKVDSKKIDISRRNLDKTVSLVNEFFDEEESLEPIDETKEDVANEDDNSYTDVLARILDQGFISVDEVQALAKKDGLTLNTFIGNINESLFDYIGDQTLVVEDKKVIIDEFYVDMIKEYVDGSKN
ncbi:tellurite resistance TerB C-terminal domain-containing protein [Anaerococcus cruorum]|uniref:tellurite resistance TerB C-terminal domain-containing protein n=1 Tax=Anaerococcus sp. WGS1529 TaxID=3366812 RepID=UPI00372D0886